MPTLNWIGKDKVVTHHNDVPYRVLDRKYTFGDAPDSGNKIIHGDNLEALKALLPEYEGKIKCIYIDPPYNTGNEGWIYNDNVNDPHIKKWLGQVVGSEVDDLTRHDKWLCMMYPRLVLLQKLLSEDGAIFISIDDNEQANLKLICDEIFGKSNFVGIFKWNRVAKAPSLSYSIRTKYEYIIMYKKGDIGKLYGKSSYNTMAPLWHLPNKAKELLFPARSIKVPGNFSVGNYSDKYQVELLDDIVEEGGFNRDAVRIVACSAWGQDKIDEYLKEGNYFVVKKNFSTVYTCMNPENSFIAPSDLISFEECGVKRNTEANDDMKKMGIDFDYSKPYSLIQYLAEIVTHSAKNAIILDSFAGSGTTAQAVLNLNKQDGGNRKFILCEMMDYAETITAERVRRVMSGYGEGKNAVEGTGGSFDFYELGETIFDPVSGNLNDNADTEQIRRYVWFSETNSAYVAPSEDAHPFLLGSYQHNNYYFFYIKGEETCLDWDFLNTFTERDRAEMYIIYADRCVLTPEEMLKHNVVFKKIPRDIKRV